MGQQAIKPAALTAAVPDGAKLAGRSSFPQLTLGYSACGKATGHMVPVDTTSAGSQSIVDIQDRSALEPAQMEQPAGCNTQGTCAPLAVPRRWRLSHCWPGILHSIHVNPFQVVWERQVCHWDGALQEGSLGAGPFAFHGQLAHGSPCTRRAPLLEGVWQNSPQGLEWEGT